MLIYKYDGTIDGIFSCVFHSFTEKETPDILSDGNIQISFCDNIKEIATNLENNKRIIYALYNYIGYNALCDINYAFRNGSKEKGKVIFDYIKETFIYRKNISGDFSNPCVMDFFDLVRKVGNEAHKMKGFLRFSECKDKIYYAQFAPDHDIVDLVLPHFMARYNQVPFVIHDLKRNKIAMSNGKESKVVKADNSFYIPLSDSEKSFQILWRLYYKSVNISERKNEKLMRAEMPVRYYKYMTERQTIL